MDDDYVDGIFTDLAKRLQNAVFSQKKSFTATADSEKWRLYGKNVLIRAR